MHAYVECGNGFGSDNLLTALYVLTSLTTNYKDVTCPTEGYKLDFSLHLQGQQFTCGLCWNCATGTDARKCSICCTQCILCTV